MSIILIYVKFIAGQAVTFTTTDIIIKDGDVQITIISHNTCILNILNELCLMKLLTNVFYVSYNDQSKTNILNTQTSSNL